QRLPPPAYDLGDRSRPAHAHAGPDARVSTGASRHRRTDGRPAAARAGFGSRLAPLPASGRRPPCVCRRTRLHRGGLLARQRYHHPVDGGPVHQRRDPVRPRPADGDHPAAVSRDKCGAALRKSTCRWHRQYHSLVRAGTGRRGHWPAAGRTWTVSPGNAARPCRIPGGTAAVARRAHPGRGHRARGECPGRSGCLPDLRPARTRTDPGRPDASAYAGAGSGARPLLLILVDGRSLMNSGLLPRILVGAIVAGALLGALLAFDRPESFAATQTTDDAYVQADFTVIAPQVAGVISQVAVEDNQAVAAGAALVSIDDRKLTIA